MGNYWKNLKYSGVLVSALAGFVRPTSGQLSNDSLYESIVAGRLDALQLQLDAGVSSDLQISVPRSRLKDPAAPESQFLLEVALKASNDRAGVALLEAGATISLLEDRVGHFSIPVFMAIQGVTNTLAYWVDRNTSEFIAEGGLPLVAAVFHGRTDTAEYLLGRMRSAFSQVELQATLDEALVRGIATGIDWDFVEQLLDAGANPESAPIVVAAVANCFPDSLDELLQLGLDHDVTYEGRPLAYYALRCIRDDNAGYDSNAFARIVTSLHEAGADVCESLANLVEQNEVSEAAALAIEELDTCR